MKPKRIQRKRIKGWKMPPNTVYVGRPGKFGNPFSFQYWIDAAGYSKMAAKQTVVDNFRYCLEKDSEPNNDEGAKRMRIIKRDLHELGGKNLACWCRLDEPCHADVLLEFANE